MTIGRYSVWVAAWSAGLWAIFLSLGVAPGFEILQQQGVVLPLRAIWVCAWLGFFVGFISSLSSSLQIRRSLLMGFVQPSAEEWSRLVRPGASRPAGFWRWVALFSLGLACVLGGLMALLSWIGASGGVTKLAYILTCVLGPAFGAAGICLLSARRSVIAFVADMESGRSLRMSRSRYILLHNVLPYAVFNTLMGLALATSRFMPTYLEGRGVAAPEFARHLGATAFIISLLVVAAALAKTRTDYLGPLELTGSAQQGKVIAWRVWYAFLIPIGIWAGFRLGMLALEIEELRVPWALSIKALLCLSLTACLTWWAVGSIWRRMETGGLDEHRYVRIFRLLKKMGFVDRR